MKKKMIGILVLLAIAGCNEKKATTENVKSQVAVQGEIKKVEVEKKVEVVVPAKTKSGYMPNLKSVSNVVAIEQYRKASYYESIAAYLEGFRPNIYNDNIGFAWAFGWNVSMQNAKTNAWLTSSVGVSIEDQKAIVALSGDTNKKVAPAVNITPGQGIQAVTLMRKIYEGGNGIRSIIKPAVYDQLKPNEQAALVYHTYKVGPGGAAKYKTMNGLISDYVKAPTPEKALRIGSEFKYSYMLRGQKMYDTRSGAYLAAMFSNPEAYGAMIGANAAPKDLEKILASVKYGSIDSSKPIPEQIEKLDNFNRVKEDMLKKGEKFDPTPLEGQIKKTAYKFDSGIMG